MTGFGDNPSNIRMYLYIPDKVQAHPPVLVGLHWCHGTRPAFYSGTQFAAQADKYGFIVIYPNANSGDSCWDVHSQAALKHGGGSDPASVVSMVRYVVRNYNADSNRVYATGDSSGGMMTNVMLGSYPDVFRAGAAFAGAGRMTVDLLRIDGVRLGTIAEADSPSGGFSLAWSGVLGGRPAGPGVYIASAKLNGEPLGALRFAWVP